MKAELQHKEVTFRVLQQSKRGGGKYIVDNRSQSAIQRKLVKIVHDLDNSKQSDSIVQRVPFFHEDETTETVSYYHSDTDEQYHVTLLPDNREHVTYERKGMDYKFYYFPFSTTKPFNFDTEMYEIIAEDLVQQWVVFESEYPDYRNIWNSNH